MSDETKRDDELGALWVKQGKSGEFMTGSVICTQCKHKEDIILFTNQFKTKENHPAWRILKSRQQGEAHTYAPSTRRDEQMRDPRPPTRQQTLGVRPEEFDSGTRPQQTYQPRPKRNWTDDVPHPADPLTDARGVAITDDDIPF